MYTEDEATTQEKTGRRPPYDPSRKIPVAEIPAHLVWRSRIEGLRPGSYFEYRITLRGNEVFAAEGRARCGPKQACRAAVYGDIGYNTPAQRRIAHKVHDKSPDFVAIPGDIVYLGGRVSEYREYFFPIQNADAASPKTGAPLLRSRLTMPGLGFHDSQLGDHDNLGYFMYWDIPLNGPAVGDGVANSVPLLTDSASGHAIHKAIGSGFSQRGNYSFDFGPAHWTVLDTNGHTDWNSEQLRDWLRADLRSAESRAWRFVLCYLPPFHSGKDYNWQKMRVIADILQNGKVDIVFSGFHHSYQRTCPLTFELNARVVGVVTVCDTVFPGTFRLDQRYDGRQRTRPEGVIYVTTGGGGWVMLNPEQTNRPETWQPYTTKFIADQRSFTLMDIDPDRVSVEQIGEYGELLDSFVVTR